MGNTISEEFSHEEISKWIDDHNMTLLVERDSKSIYLSNDKKTVRILHSHSMDFNREQCGSTDDQKIHYDSIIHSYQLAEQKLDGKLIDHGQFEPERLIVFEMPYKGVNFLDVIKNKKKATPEIVFILEKQIPSIVKSWVHKKIYHTDFAFRNLCLNSDDQLSIIDYDSITDLAVYGFSEDFFNTFLYEIKQLLPEFVEHFKSLIHQLIIDINGIEN